MRRQRRETEVFSISFLDVITCGFGAIILLIMISRPGAPVILEEAPESHDGVVAALQQELFAIRGESRVLNRDLNAKREQLSVFKERVARLSSDLAALERRQAGVARDASAEQALKADLELALQSLTEEMRRLQAQRQQIRTDIVGGIPVDSEYIIFLIDTSGSMFHYAWPRVLEELVGVLDVYPKVKGIQVLNDMGDHMFDNYRGQWIPDTPARRKIIIDRLRTWNPFSNSSPVEGLIRAVRTYANPAHKISIYIFGDDFTGDSIRKVIDEVDRLNPRGPDGQPLIRIHAVGFPVLHFAHPSQQATAVRFAALMRELANRNMGSFVGLNDFRGTRSNLHYNIRTPF
jgi:hypothetical protein